MDQGQPILYMALNCSAGFHITCISLLKSQKLRATKRTSFREKPLIGSGVSLYTLLSNYMKLTYNGPKGPQHVGDREQTTRAGVHK